MTVQLLRFERTGSQEINPVFPAQYLGCWVFVPNAKTNDGPADVFGIIRRMVDAGFRDSADSEIEIGPQDLLQRL
jgi:hypothetical protein